MATKKALSATGPNVQKSVTVAIRESTVEGINSAADVVGAPKDATVALGNAPYVAPPADGNTADDIYPWQVTFTWSESTPAS